MKKFICILLCLCTLLLVSVPAFADVTTTECVAIGADLTSDQIASVYQQFGISRGSVTELTVTNAEERNYLEGVVSETIIGTRSISCIYIKLLSGNDGLTVTANNINWCTEDMYKSALMTAGIYDAEVIVAAPFSVSGTAALTGVYKAYETITGTQLEEAAKETAVDELVVTAELADEISDADAVAIVNELKLILDETQKMSDDELQTEIEDIADDYGYTIDQDLIDKLISLCRSMEGLSIADLQEKVEQFKNTVATVSDYAQQAVTFGQKVANFFQKVSEAFNSIFGNKEE